MSTDGPDLNLLVPLRALLEETNVSRAAQQAGMGQSSMSAALVRLRDVFGDELLVRVGREYELTPMARLLLPQVQATVPMIEQLFLAEDQLDPAAAERTFTLMMSDYGAMRLYPALASVIEQASASIEVDIVPLPTRPMESDRDLTAHDFIVSVPGIGIDGRSADLFVDEYVCLIDPHNAALIQETLTFEAFLALPQAVAQFGPAHFTPAERRLRELGVTRTEPRMSTAGFLSLPSIVSGTDLVAVVPRFLAEWLGPMNGTISVAAPFGHVPIDLKLWWHESHDSDPLHTWFRTQLLAAVRDSTADRTTAHR